MPRGHQYIEFEGLFSENVLDIFRIIRGVAGFLDFVTIYICYIMSKGTNSETTFHLAEDLTFIWTQ
jgi:hypothetical protein